MPDVVGKQLTDAVATLTRAGLNAKSVGVPSDKPSGTVTAQDPTAGHLARRGRDRADQLLHGPEAGRRAARRRPRLLDRAPAAPGRRLRGRPNRRRERPARRDRRRARCRAARRPRPRARPSTLSVSNGPQTTPLPDVTGQTEADAKATLTAAGFKVTRDAAGHRRRDVRRRRDLAGSAGQHPAGSEHDRDALRRRLRAPGRHDTTDTTDRHDDDHRPP